MKIEYLKGDLVKIPETPFDELVLAIVRTTRNDIGAAVRIMRDGSYENVQQEIKNLQENFNDAAKKLEKVLSADKSVLG